MATQVASTHIHSRAKTSTRLQAVNWIGGWALHNGPAPSRILSLYPVMQKPSDHDAKTTWVNVFGKRAKLTTYCPAEDVVWPLRKSASASATTPRVLQQASRAKSPKRQTSAGSPRGSESAVVHHDLVRLRLPVSPLARRLVPQEARRGVLFPPGDAVFLRQLSQTVCQAC